MLGKSPITGKGTFPTADHSNPISCKMGRVQLPTGKLIRAKVLKQLDGPRVVILFNGRKISARTDWGRQTAPALKIGRDYLFFVKPSSNEIVLKLFSPHRGEPQQMLKIWNATQLIRPKLTLLLKQLLNYSKIAQSSAKGSHSGDLKALGSLISSIFLDLRSSKSSLQLKELIARGGLFWEAKVAQAFQEGATPDPTSDLKALLRLLEHALDKEGKKECQELLWLIEQQQQINVKGQTLGQWWFFLVPVVQDQELEPAEIYVKNEKGKGLRIVIHLRLSNLGRMEVVVFLPNAEAAGERNFVDVAMGVETEEVRTMVEQSASSLDQSLRGQGFSLRTFHCQVVERPCMLPPMLESEDSGPIVDVVV